MTKRGVRWPARLVAAAAAGLIFGVAAPAWADSIRDKQWHLAPLGVAAAHGVSQGEGVIVAVIDTGVDASHPDLDGNVLPGIDLTGPGDGHTDPDGHGTAMAADIAAHGHGPGNSAGVLGLAPKSKILPVRFTAGQKGGDLGAGIRWAADHGAKILNVSSVSPDLSSVRDATTYALGKGVIIVAGTGNNGSTDVGAPALYPGVVAVGGVDKNNGAWAKSNHGPETVITAPAIDIVSAKNGGGYAIENGTSDATALVSGTAALIWSKYPQLDANNVINRLVATADDKGDPGRDPQYGYGVINPGKALTVDVPAVTSNPLLAVSTPAPSQKPTTAAAAPASSSASPSSSAVVIIVVVAVLTVVVAAAVVLVVVAKARRRRRGAYGAIPQGPGD
ncbi:type VII secretion-associated serine protease mycosin [Longispora sp. K20-0274]|uniref:type VII secretion-associated serine protease mycosin n=1 Tax=Longispora sp. K20-0274 TaxID=3088255 RepID=UPI00399B11BF